MKTILTLEKRVEQGQYVPLEGYPKTVKGGLEAVPEVTLDNGTTVIIEHRDRHTGIALLRTVSVRRFPGLVIRGTKELSAETKSEGLFWIKNTDPVTFETKSGQRLTIRREEAQ